MCICIVKVQSYIPPFLSPPSFPPNRENLGFTAKRRAHDARENNLYKDTRPEKSPFQRHLFRAGTSSKVRLEAMRVHYEFLLLVARSLAVKQ